MAAPFALYPGSAMPGIVDLSNADGRKYWDKTTGAFNHEPFNADAEGLYGFTADLGYHAQKYGWTEEYEGIFWIPNDVGTPAGDVTNLLTNYGQVAMGHLREWVETYIDTESREAQDDVQAFFSLRESLSSSALTKLNLYKSEYTVGSIPSGVLFYKVILRESHLDTNATALTIRTQLGSDALTKYLGEVSYDITKFNQHTLLLVESLNARGETSSDLLANLLIAFATVKDEEFHRYVGQKRSEYEDGEKDFTYEQLMTLFENKYKNLVQTERWTLESYEDKFLALQAQQEKANREVEKIKRKKVTWKDGGKNGGKKGDKSKKGKQRDNNDLPAWMKVEPSPDKLFEPREWNGKLWYFCSKKTGGKCDPGCYRRHKPEQCEGLAKKRKAPEKKVKSDQKSNKKKLKVAKALIAAVESESDSESDE